MTRRRDLMCEDIFCCTHEPETPVTDGSGEIAYWVCRCGTKRTAVDQIQPTHETKETDENG